MRRRKHRLAMLKRPTHRMVLGPVEPKEADAFWTALDKSGATSSIVAADNYVTIVELSGTSSLFKVEPPPYRFYIDEPGHA